MAVDTGWTAGGVVGAGLTKWNAEDVECMAGMAGGVFASLCLELTVMGEVSCKNVGKVGFAVFGEYGGGSGWLADGGGGGGVWGS